MECAARPIAEGLFTQGDRPRLIGGRHRVTGRIVFPCPRGGEAESYEPVELGREGTVWSHTIQRFRPKSPPYAGPDAFEPFVVAYVELPGEVIVETRLVDINPEAVRTGMAVEMTVTPFAQDADGTSLLTYAFRPVGEVA